MSICTEFFFRVAGRISHEFLYASSFVLLPFAWMLSMTEKLDSMRKLSPLRNTTRAVAAEDLAEEQLAHFGIDPATEFGRTLKQITRRLYESQGDLEELWRLTLQSIHALDRADRIAYFNAKKFLSFQLRGTSPILFDY